jgi:2-oxoisovalerate dehydrogenase E1 component alpha subunit
MNQLFANKIDSGKGRNMPVHYGSGKHNIVISLSPSLSLSLSLNYPNYKSTNHTQHTISSPLATQIPHAAGAAYALKLQDSLTSRKDRRIVACYFGEGAASEGDFHAALNIAATRSCPVVFVCRNNGFAISTPTLEQYRGDGIASRGIGYGIDTIRVDGNDIFAVHSAMQSARQLALQDGGKPVLLEAMSYRVSHHSTSDDSFAYRAKVEVEDWKRRDNPITRLRKWMERKGVWNEERERELRSEARKELLAAFKLAESEAKPALRELWTDVWSQVLPEQREQMAEMKSMIVKYPGEYDVSAFEGGVEGLDPNADSDIDGGKK